MILFEELYHLNLSNLKFAVEQFDTMIPKFKNMDTACGTDVVKPFERAGWDSADVTATVARAQITYVEQEFSDALRQTKGLHGILSDTHDDLKKYRDELKNLVDTEARTKDIRVNGRGEASAREDLAEKAPNDPDTDEAVAKQQREVEKFQARIDKVVLDAGRAEKMAASALRQAVRGKEGEGFNGKAYSSVDSYESARATKLLRKLDKNADLSPSEVEDLSWIMRENQHDPEFSRMTLNSLGPDKTLLLADELAQQRSGEELNSRSDRKQFAVIERSFANTIGTANKDKEFSKGWRKQMRDRGTDKLGEDSYNKGGYQALAGLLKRGSDPYPEHMTTGLTDDMLAAEKKDPGLWDEHQTILPSGDAKAERVNDPVDDMLETMSRNPDASTSYLDPEGNEKRLSYLLDKRDWPDIEAREQTTGGDPTGTVEKADATNSRTGLGHVIEAATRGDEPGSPIDRGEHTEAQARIMRDTIHLMDNGPQKEDIPENMREPLGNATADYTEDTHEILRGVNGEYKSEAQSGDGVFTDEKGAHAAPNSHELIRFMRGVSEDPDAYGTMHRAETAYVSEQMDALPHDATGGDVRGPARDGAAVLGVYDAIRDDVTHDKQETENSDTDWNAKVGYHLIGAPVTAVPVVGDSAQRAVDAWTADMANQIKDDNDAETAAAVSKESLKSQNQTNFLVEKWAEERGIDPNSRAIDNLEHDIRSDQNTERDYADKALGR